MENRASKINGRLITLVILALAIFSTDCTPNEPTPSFHFSLNLIEPPRPLVPTITPFKHQQAQANATFKFNLASSIEVSQPEFGYQIYNNSRDIDYETSHLMGSNQRISGLPNGVRQINTKPGDCPSFFTLSYNKSCLLRFHVDKNTDTSLQDGYGPMVLMHMTWKWGSKQNRNGGENIFLSPSQTIANILQPIMLPTQIHVTPTEQYGLRYDPVTESITGNPTRTGDYHFKIGATIGNARAIPQDLTITVSSNPHDTPVFRPHYSLASAMPEKEYRLNLMELIEPTPGFAVNNQVRFRIHQDPKNAPWLSLDKENSTVLKGHPPSSDAGQIKTVTIIATSNTGGDSLPMTIQVPVAYDLGKRPVIKKGIELTGKAGAELNENLQASITDPTADGSLKLILDKIIPSAPWLTFSSKNPIELVGLVPANATGQLYQVTLHANTAIGGNSDSVTIPLQIDVDNSKTPRFYSDKPELAPLYAGQSYSYDFVSCNDIVPEYSDIAYTVELAKDYNNPDWVRIADNKLIVDNVPINTKTIQPIFIYIKNLPGGRSNVLAVNLFIIH